MLRVKAASIEALSVLSGIIVAWDDARLYQKACGRSEEGRRWSVIITELEKIEALVNFYDVGGGLKPKGPRAGDKAQSDPHADGEVDP